MAKKRRVKKNIEEENGDVDKKCNCRFISIKLAIVAFVLFLITIWPWLSRALLSVHWGIYLAITILALIIPQFCPCKKK